LTHTEIVALYGSREKQLQRVRWRNNLTSEETEKPVRLVFCFIGAEPATGWLRDSGVALDGKNFILTGSDVPRDTRWSNNGSGRPLPLETSVRNVFASGDVGSGSVERVGTAIGEGCRRRRRTACRAHKWRRGGAARRNEVKRRVTKRARRDFALDDRQGRDWS
jgi:thioredoxin reductase (NADPH)